eukprot:364218-Chlamydomonas_euryale.AAC.11
MGPAADVMELGNRTIPVLHHILTKVGMSAGDHQGIRAGHLTGPCAAPHCYKCGHECGAPRSINSSRPNRPGQVGCGPTCVDQPVWTNLCGPTCVGQTVWTNLCGPNCVDQPVWANLSSLLLTFRHVQVASRHHSSPPPSCMVLRLSDFGMELGRSDEEKGRFIEGRVGSFYSRGENKAEVTRPRWRSLCETAHPLHLPRTRAPRPGPCPQRTQVAEAGRGRVQRMRVGLPLLTWSRMIPCHTEQEFEQKPEGGVAQKWFEGEGFPFWSAGIAAMYATEVRGFDLLSANLRQLGSHAFHW